MTDIYVREIPEDRIENRPLGRHVRHDPRSWKFPAEKSAAIYSVRHMAVGLPLTQVRGSCTAEALCGALNSRPDFAGAGHHIMIQPDAERLYDAEIVLEGGDPKTDDPGGSGLNICKVAQQDRLIGSYQHAFGIDHVMATLTLRPVIVGVDWYASFDNADPRTGLVSLDESSGVRGGHEFLLDEINAQNRTFGAWNSWGIGYGRLGRFYVPWNALDFLLKNDGDCTVPIV